MDNIASKYVMSRKDAAILLAAKQLCSMYEDRFSDAARNNLDKVTEVYSLAKTAQSFSDAETMLSRALTVARIHAEQDALND